MFTERVGVDLIPKTLQGRLRLRKALCDAYSPYFGRTLNPETDIVITAGANEGQA